MQGPTISCPLCGKNNASNKALCDYCGVKLTPPSASTTLQTQAAKSAPVNPRDLLAQVPPYPNILLEAVGVNGQLQLFADRIRIKRKGTMAALTVGLKGDKDILISSITSIQCKECGALTNGYLQFAFIGGIEAKGALMQATSDENTVMFTIHQQPQFLWFRECVEKQRALVLAAQSAPTVNQAPALSPLDELEKLASLRDRGIVTDAEFEAKKKQLLGL